MIPPWTGILFLFNFQINPLKKEDEGVYQCHSANAVGEAQSHGTVTVVDLSQYKAPRFPAPDDHM